MKEFNDIYLTHIKVYDNNTIIGLGNLLVWTNDSTKVYLYDINIGKILNKVGYMISNLAYDISKLTNQMAVISYNSQTRFVEVWDLSKLERISTLGTHDSPMNDLSFSSDGKYLASASSDGIIKVWDVQERKLVKELRHLDMKDGYLKIKFSPKGGYLVSSGGINFDFNTIVWDINYFTQAYKYSELIGASRAIDISQDATKIALGRSYKLFLLNSKWNLTGVENPVKPIENILYPNPSGGYINLPIIDGKIPSRITITDTLGKLILSDDMLKITSLEMRIDMGLLLPGVYFISVTYPDKTITYKFLK